MESIARVVWKSDSGGKEKRSVSVDGIEIYITNCWDCEDDIQNGILYTLELCLEDMLLAI